MTVRVGGGRKESFVGAEDARRAFLVRISSVSRLTVRAFSLRRPLTRRVVMPGAFKHGQISGLSSGFSFHTIFDSLTLLT